MGRILKTKELKNTRLATTYGGWMYCTECNENIGYLCYVTYDYLKFQYECGCGSKGAVFINFEDTKTGDLSKNEFVTIKNRLCCPSDESPLITVYSKKLKTYHLEIMCKDCGSIYKSEKKDC